MNNENVVNFPSGRSVGARNPKGISQRGLDLLMAFEGFVPYAYDDADPSEPRKRIMPGDAVMGVLTIGHGHTGPDVFPGQTITEDEASELLARDLRNFESAVREMVRAPIRQGQYDALVCWAFNIGVAAAKRSTAISRLNAGDDHGCAEAMMWFKYTTINGKKVESAGLVRRRNAERALFFH